MSEPQSELGAFLKMLRQRVAPESTVLGPYERLPSRHGRRVTQEELAEAVGVSRGWYKLLESGARVRSSMPLLERLAQALGATADERSKLFSLAAAEMWGIEIGSGSRDVLESFSWVRSTTKRLWVASSQSEAYTVASERIAEQLENATLVDWMSRNDSGVWERHSVASRAPSRVMEAVEELCASFAATRQHDSLLLYPQLHEPGAVGTSEQLSHTTESARRGIFARRGVAVQDFAHARVRSRSGLIGGLNVAYEAGTPVSETERMVLGTLAQLTSLALS
jgi:transcriptional regulator with XRE-family HTH domain